MAIDRERWGELLAALDSGDEAGYMNGFEIGDEDSAEHHDVQLERDELRELLNIYGNLRAYGKAGS